MNSEIVCRVRVRLSSDTAAELKDATECTDISPETRLLWAKSIINEFQKTDNQSRRQPRDLIATLNGLVQSIPSVELQSLAPNALYPARYRIPPSTLYGLSEEEIVPRANLFVMGSLVYETLAGKRLFAGLTNDKVQELFSRGEFPQDCFSLPMWNIICGGWSLEFFKYIIDNGTENSTENGLDTAPTLFHKPGEFIRTNPIKFGLAAGGAIVAGAALVTIPFLGFVGFGALGPVAGSAAAAWQSSVGIVQAGSFFAWCQSAAMGGAAINGIIAAGVAGAGAAVAGVAIPVSEDQKAKFYELVRKVEAKEALERGGVEALEGDGVDAEEVSGVETKEMVKEEEEEEEEGDNKFTDFNEEFVGLSIS